MWEIYKKNADKIVQILISPVMKYPIDDNARHNARMEADSLNSQKDNCINLIRDIFSRSDISINVKLIRAKYTQTIFENIVKKKIDVYETHHWQINNEQFDVVWLNGVKDIFKNIESQGIEEFYALINDFEVDNLQLITTQEKQSKPPKCSFDSSSPLMKAWRAAAKEIITIKHEAKFQLLKCAGIAENCNKILTVSKNDLAKTYKKCALQFHPDKNNNSEESINIFKQMHKLITSVTDEIQRQYKIAMGNFHGFYSLAYNDIDRLSEKLYSQHSQYTHQKKTDAELQNKFNSARAEVEQLNEQLINNKKSSEDMRKYSKKQTQKLKSQQSELKTNHSTLSQTSTLLEVHGEKLDAQSAKITEQNAKLKALQDMMSQFQNQFDVNKSSVSNNQASINI